MFVVIIYHFYHHDHSSSSLIIILLINRITRAINVNDLVFLKYNSIPFIAMIFIWHVLQYFKCWLQGESFFSQKGFFVPELTTFFIDSYLGVMFFYGFSCSSTDVTLPRSADMSNDGFTWVVVFVFVALLCLFGSMQAFLIIPGKLSVFSFTSVIESLDPHARCQLIA